MLRTLTAFALISMLLSSLFLKSFVLLDFKLHQKEISQTICVQKDAKFNTCNGKCHLAKQLKKSEDGESESPAPQRELNEAPMFNSSVETFDLVVSELESVLNQTEPSLNGISAIQSIFHPPPFTLV